MGLGLLVYWTQRDAQQTLLVPAITGLSGLAPFGALGQWLPSFVHALAFSLFTAALLPPRAACAYGACVSWAAVNVAFEVAQHPLLAAAAAEAAHAALGPPAVASALAGYFVLGTFDTGDIAAAIAGALAAALLLRRPRREGARS